MTLSTWVALAAVLPLAAAGVTFRAASERPSPPPDAEDGVVINLRSTNIAMHLTPQRHGDIQKGCHYLNRALSVVSIKKPCLQVIKALEGDSGDRIGTGPETSVANYRLSIKGDRARMDFGGSAMLGRFGADGAIGEWKILDPTTGRIVDSDAFSQSIESAGELPFGAGSGSGTSSPFRLDNEVKGPTRSGVTEVIAGHTARKYDYSYDASILAHAGGGEHGGFGISVVGEIWYAEEGPYAADQAVVAVFRKMAPHLVLSTFGGDSKALAAFAAPGVVMRVREDITVSLYAASQTGMSAGAAPLLQGESLDEVTEISRQPLADDLFGAFAQPQQACDCSCDAYKELKAIGDLPKKEQEAHPKAMSLSMCAPECGMQWAMSCGKKR
jgi:hypothetical protein